MLNGEPCKHCLNQFRDMLFLVIDISHPYFFEIWNNMEKKTTNPLNIAELLNIISHFLPRNSNLERRKKSERWHIDFDSIVLPRHTMNRFIISSINRFTIITGRDTISKERTEFNKHINATCFNCHCDNCISKYLNKHRSYIDFNPLIDSGMRYLRLILTKMIIKCLTTNKNTIPKILGYNRLTCLVEISAYEKIIKELTKWIKTHIEISYKNKEFMSLMNQYKWKNSVTLQQFYNQIYEIPIQLIGIVPLEHYQNFHSGYITDVIAGHPKASNGWMKESINDMEEMGVF